MTNDKTTHFGFKQVATDQKVNLVRGVFDSVAGQYDIMNDLMSLGIHRIWKRVAVQLSNVRKGEQVLDLAGGTGDLTVLFEQRVGKDGQVILADINSEMLRTGRDRLIDKGLTGNVRYAQVNAECLPFEDNTFDCVCIAFGLRNVTDKDAALRSMYRVLKPGGRVIVLEFVAKDEDSYRYLAESIRMHPKQDELKKMMENAGLERCEYFNMSQGIVAVHRGYKI
jgi:demethylmenaquinone methyltransferase/2-methoxy-6-polyprenyl-1,4-benzoquinol methylase